MSNPRTITLDGRTFEVRPLTLGVIEDISAANAGLLEEAKTPQARTRLVIRVRCEAIVAAVSTPEQKLTVADMYKMNISNEELIEAHNKVLEIAGLVPKKAKTEAKEGATGEIAEGEAKAETAA